MDRSLPTVTRARTRVAHHTLAVLLAPADAAYRRRVCGGCSARAIVLALAQARLELRRLRARVAA